MKKFSALFFVFILSFHTISSMKLFSIDVILPSSQNVHSQLMDILIEVQKDDSPKTVEDISNAIMEMLKKLKENQDRHAEIAKKMNSQCVTEETFRKKEIADASAAYNAASAAYAKCQKSKAAAEENLPILKRAKKDFEKNLQEKTAERNKQHELYLQRRKDWQDAIDFLNDFIKQIDTKLAKYPSFADLGEKLLRHVAKLGRMADAVEVFVALAAKPVTAEFGAHSDYSYKSQAKTVNSLNDHLRKLLNKLIVDSKQNDLDEAKAQAAFEKVKKELVSIIAKLRADIKKTKSQIVNMNSCIASEGKILSQSGNKKHRNQKLLDLAGKTCTDFAREFVTATKNRVREMKVITQILKIMKKRFGELPKDLVSYLDATKTGFKIYVNSTQFKKYEDYVAQHVAAAVAVKVKVVEPAVTTVEPTPAPAQIVDTQKAYGTPRPR